MEREESGIVGEYDLQAQVDKSKPPKGKVWSKENPQVTTAEWSHLRGHLPP